MKNKACVFAAAIASALLAGQAVQAQENVTGYNVITVPANSDALLSMPFNNKIEASFTVQSKAGTTLTPTGGTTATDFSGGTYYVRFTSGSGEGLWTTITTDNGTAFTLENATALAFVNNGDSFRVYKHHTINSLFPEGVKGTSFVDGTEVQIFANNVSVPQQNKPPVTAVTYFDGFGWFDGVLDGQTLITPETQFTVRNNSANPLTLFHFGVSSDFRVAVILPDSGDLQIGSGYGLPFKLAQLGFEGLGGPSSDGREIQVFDNAATGQNKPPITAVTFFDGFGWFDGIADGETVINPSAAVVFRLPAGSAGTKVTIKKPF